MTPEVAGWFASWWPVWAPLLVVAISGSVAGIWVIVNRRGGEKTARRNPLPPTWPEMWARIDAQDKRIDALEIELGESKGEVRALVAEATRKDNQMDELITHILKLEVLIPNPPGPPARPAWIKR